MPSVSCRSGLFRHPCVVHCTISSLQDSYIMTLVHCIVIMLHLNSFSSEVPCPYLSAIHNGSCSLTLLIRFSFQNSPPKEDLSLKVCNLFLPCHFVKFNSDLEGDQLESSILEIWLIFTHWQYWHWKEQDFWLQSEKGPLQFTGPSQGLKIRGGGGWGACSNVVGIMCPPVEIGPTCDSPVLACSQKTKYFLHSACHMRSWMTTRKQENMEIVYIFIWWVCKEMKSIRTEFSL